MNIKEWADYCHSAGADIVFISVTGILAFYPSKVEFHRHGKAATHNCSQISQHRCHDLMQHAT